MNAQIEAEKSFTINPSDMAADNSYKETTDILRLVRDVEFEIRKLEEEDKSNK